MSPSRLSDRQPSAHRRQDIFHPQPVFDAGILVTLSLGMAIAVAAFMCFDGLLAIISCGLGWVMLAIACIDFRNFIIPDVLSLPAIPVGILVSAMLSPAVEPNQVILDHALSALVAGAVFYLVRSVYFFFRQREGLGLGDVKLAAVAAAWVGGTGAIHVLILACSTALVFVLIEHVTSNNSKSDGSRALPFGAFLAPAIWLIWSQQQLALG